MGVWLGLLLVIVCAGLIAYLGDLIGRRIGRKRLTLFGMRPKNTAILITVTTGVVIAMGTVSMLLIASQDLRNRILYYTRTVNDLKRQADVQRDAANTARRDLRGVQTDLNEQRDLAASERRAANTAQQARREAEARRLDAQEALRRAEANVKSKERDLVAAARKATAAQDRLRSLRANLSSTKSQLEKAQQRLATAQQDVTKAIQAVATAKAQEQIAREAAIEQAANANNALDSRVLYRQFEEIDRELIRGDWTEAEIEATLQGVQRRLDSAAHAAGAGLDDTTGLYANPVYITPKAKQPNPPIGIKDALTPTAKNLAATHATTWVRFRAVLNCYSGKALYYMYELVPDRIVLRAGQVLATAEMDGSRTDDELIEDLRKFTVTSIRPRVEDAQLLPQIGGRPLEVSAQTWVRALIALRNLHAPATVVAEVTEDTSVGAGVLPLRMRVIPHVR